MHHRVFIHFKADFCNKSNLKRNNYDSLYKIELISSYKEGGYVNLSKLFAFGANVYKF